MGVSYIDSVSNPGCLPLTGFMVLCFTSLSLISLICEIGISIRVAIVQYEHNDDDERLHNIMHGGIYSGVEL